MLFSTPMVKAIIGGRKTETRRAISGRYIINDDPDRYKAHPFIRDLAHFEDLKYDITPWITPIKCPYGEPGDIIWARETFADGYNGSLDSNIGKEEKDWTVRYWLFKDGSQLYSSGEYFQGDGISADSLKPKWKPSIHMPKAAARIWLQVEYIQVERLNEISEECSKAEGVNTVGSNFFENYISKHSPSATAKHSYLTLWEKINGLDSVKSNPWVWVVKFKVLSTTGKPV